METFLTILGAGLILNALFLLAVPWYWMLGVKLVKLEVGIGKTVFNFTFLGTPIAIKWFPVIGTAASFLGMDALMEGDRGDKNYLPEGDIRGMGFGKRALIAAATPLILLVLGIGITQSLDPIYDIPRFAEKFWEVITLGGKEAVWNPMIYWTHQGFFNFVGIWACWAFAMQFYPLSGTAMSWIINTSLHADFRIRADHPVLNVINYIQMGLLLAMLSLMFF